MHLKKNSRIYLWLILLTVAGYTWVLLNLLFSGNTAFGICIFRSVSGIPCISCGTTHAVLNILQGNFKEAWYYNPLGFLEVLVLIVLPVILIFDLVTKKALCATLYVKAEKLLKRPVYYLPGITLIMLIWVKEIIQFH